MSPEDEKKLTNRVGIKGNVRYITITDNKPDHWDSLISIAKSNYQWWAYVYHDKDDTDKHIHLVCYDKGGTNLKSHCKRFSSVVPANFVLKVYNPRAMVRYLVHKDDSDKFQYNVDDIVTSSRDKLFNFMKDEESDVMEQFHDYLGVLHGSMTPEEFFEKYRFELSSIPFHHRVNLFHRLTHNSRECV